MFYVKIVPLIRSKARRLRKTSPIQRASKKKSPATGIMYTNEGHPFVYMWPGERKQLCLENVPRQTAVEAAAWATKDGFRNKAFIAEVNMLFLEFVTMPFSTEVL